MGPATVERNEKDAGTDGRQQRPGEPRTGSLPDLRPADGRAVGHHATNDRQHALRWIRAGASLDHLHGPQSVSRGTRCGEAVLAKPEGAERLLLEVPDR